MSMRVCHFEIHASDPLKAIAFYERLFGWQFSRFGEVEYWLITTGSADQPGINGGLLRRCGPAPVEGQAVTSYVCTVEVPALDDKVTELQAAGGTIALPKMPIPGVGWLAYGKDDQGNVFGMIQRDAQAV